MIKNRALAEKQVNKLLCKIEEKQVVSHDVKARLRDVALHSPFFLQTLPRHIEAFCETALSPGSDPVLKMIEVSALRLKSLACQNIEAFDSALRSIRYEMIHQILWLDHAALIDLDETLKALSSLADLIVKQCAEWHYQQLSDIYGYPVTEEGQKMPLAILAMGKLGGCELNFSSDIDLICAYEHDGQTDGSRTLSYHEFFCKLVQRVHSSLSAVTEDGFVYRVDLRLRPYGNSGPLAMGFAAMEEYYQTQGREWERCALIKARPIGMSVHAGQQLLNLLQPFIYRRYLDFGVIESLRELKNMMDHEVVRQDHQNHLKLGPGGIREIEFIAQVFQLVRGGQDMALRERATPVVLQQLAEKRYIDVADISGLLNAWQFLRMAENRIQQMYDRQEHTLPTNKVDQWRLAASMRFENWASFLRVLAAHREQVQRCFDQVFSRPVSPAHQEINTYWLSISSSGELADHDKALLENLAYDYKWLHELLCRMKVHGIYPRLSAVGQKRCDDLIPLIIHENAGHKDSNTAVERLFKVIQAIARREVYLAMLLEKQLVRKHLAKLCVSSLWLTDTIAQYPALLDELIDARILYAPPDRQGLQVELNHLLASIDSGDTERQMDCLRHFRQARQLCIAAADIAGVLPLERVSEHLSWLAESVLEAVFEQVWCGMVMRYGVPTYDADGETRVAGFAVIGFGKLGGIELGYGSDLDLVFLHDSHGSRQITNGKKSIENSVFFTRLAQRLVHFLSTLTPAGVLYHIDTRLRPNGGSGLLVSSLDAFERYQMDDAWVWEHQALVRGRYISGNRSIGDAFEKIRGTVLSQSRDRLELRSAVFAMRQRMRSELDQSHTGQFDLKHGVGGIVDIEFMVQYMVLSEACQNPRLRGYTDVVGILESACGERCITSVHRQALVEAYQAYRGRIHRQVLQGLGRCVAEEDHRIYRQTVISAWLSIFDELA